MSASRISGRVVPAHLPEQGPVRVLCIGEAPGPRGADKSGVPFFGDRAGLPLYRALVEADACVLPAMVETLPWDGSVFAEHGLQPTLREVAVGNAFPSCPTNDGVRFRAPTRTELEAPENQQRLMRDLDTVSARGLVLVLTLGRVATRTMEALFAQHAGRWPEAVVHAVPHPSAQGLLSAAPDRGRGARLADLAEAWQSQVAALVRDAMRST